MPTTKYGITKRFGARYGRRIKEKIGKIEEQSKGPQACPHCGKVGVKRRAPGIWSCVRCGEFTGYAYTVAKVREEEKAVEKVLTITEHKSKREQPEEAEE